MPQLPPQLACGASRAIFSSTSLCACGAPPSRCQARQLRWWWWRYSFSPAWAVYDPAVTWSNPQGRPGGLNAQSTRYIAEGGLVVSWREWRKRPGDPVLDFQPNPRPLSQQLVTVCSWRESASLQFYGHGFTHPEEQLNCCAHGGGRCRFIAARADENYAGCHALLVPGSVFDKVQTHTILTHSHSLPHAHPPLRWRTSPNVLLSARSPRLYSKARRALTRTISCSGPSL